jgi:hypothetical protein
MKLRDISGQVERGWFWLRNGFDYQDCWSLDVSLAKWLAPRLTHFAKNSMGYPGVKPYSGEFGNDKWRADLWVATKAVVAYSKKWDAKTWEEEDRIHSGYKSAMRWVAEWVGYLWD